MPEGLEREPATSFHFFIYIFPSFVLIGPLLRYIFSQDFHNVFTLVVPDFDMRTFWWAPLQALIVDCLLLGRKRPFSTFSTTAPA